MVALQSSFINASFAARGGYGYESNIFISTCIQTHVHIYMHLCEYAHTHTNRHINNKHENLLLSHFQGTR